MESHTSPPKSLRDYIISVGEDIFQQRHQVTARATKAYRFEQRRPEFETAKRIVEHPESPLTWDTIYAPSGYQRQTRTPRAKTVAGGRR